MLGIQDASQIEIHPQRGALFETWVVSEAVKARYNHALPLNLYFWRDRSGHEIDLLIDLKGMLLPVEIKSGLTSNSDWFKPMEFWFSLRHARHPDGWLVYGGEESHQHKNTRLVGWRHLDALWKKLAT